MKNSTRRRLAPSNTLALALALLWTLTARSFALGGRESPPPAAPSSPLSASPVSAPASTPKAGPLSLTVEEAVSLARIGNLSLVESRLDTESKRRASELAWNNFVPSADLSVTLGRWNLEQSAAIPAPPFSIELPRWTLSSSLSVQLQLNLALFEGIRALKAEYEAGRVSFAAAEARLERDVRKSFYNLLLIQESVKLMEEQLAAAERRAEQARANYRAGRAPELAMLQAQVAYENMKPALAEMKIGYLAARDAFAMSLGLPRGAEPEPVGAIAPAYVALDGEALAAAASARPDLAALVEAAKALAVAEKAAAYRLKTPSLILAYNADPSFNGDPWADALFEGDSWKQRSGMFRATLAMRLNGLFPYTQESEQLATMRERRLVMEAGLAQARRGAELEIDAVVRRLTKSKDARAALALNVGLAERAYRLAEEAYRAGVSDLAEVQNAELELRKAQLELLKEDYAYVVGILDLEYATGGRFGALAGENK
jgi:outer membrane protein TolC